MSTPLALPDWVPWWAQLLALIVAIMLTLCFVLMPFSVFGLKPRLEAIEARLDEIQGEIRALSLRLPEPAPRPSLVSEPPLQAAPAAARPRSLRFTGPRGVWSRGSIGAGRQQFFFEKKNQKTFARWWCRNAYAN
jgi:hypothetical protein